MRAATVVCLLLALASSAAPPALSDLRQGPYERGLAVLTVRIAAEQEPFAPTVWYRERGRGPFLAAGLVRAGDRWEARVPLPGFQYYLEVYDHAAGQAATLGSPEKPLVYTAPDTPAGLKLAVLELEGELAGASASSDRNSLADRVSAALRKALPGATVIAGPRGGQPSTGAGRKPPPCEGSCAAQEGRSLGADLVVSGRVSRDGKGLALALRLQRTTDGTLLGEVTAPGVAPERIGDEVGKAAEKLAAGLAAR